MTNSNIIRTELKQQNWYLIDAENLTLGRLATQVAKILIGKHCSNYVPYRFPNDCVIIINAQKINVTGKKETQKMYYRHSGYPGGLRSESLSILKDRIPERILEKAIKGMLPKNKLGRKMFQNVKIYKDTFHPHLAQNPTKIEIK